MSLFEIELNHNFLFKNGSPFLTEDDFYRFYKQNNIHSSFLKEEFMPLLYEDTYFEVQHYSILMNRLQFRRNAYEDLKRIIKMDIYEAYYQHKENHSGTELTQDLFGCANDKTLYPAWQLFYISIGKLMFSHHNQKEFIENISYFRKLSDMIFKEYLIRNCHIDLTFKNNEKLFEFKNELFVIFNDYNKSVYTSEGLIDFLKYLLKLHYLLCDNEKYKLMWNLESTYILNTIYVLKRSFNYKYNEIIEAVKDPSGQIHQTEINSIYKELNTHVKENKFYYANKSVIELINNTLKMQTEENEVIEKLVSNKMYLELLDSIIEINKRFFSNKRSESTVLSVTTGVILNTEIFIKERSSIDNGNLFKHVTNLSENIDSQLLEEYRDIMPFNATENEFFENYYKLIEKEDSLEKYFMIYIHARNYIAHNIVNFEKFFYENDRKVITNILNSISLILYYLEKCVDAD